MNRGLMYGTTALVSALLMTSVPAMATTNAKTMKPMPISKRQAGHSTLSN